MRRAYQLALLTSLLLSAVLLVLWPVSYWVGWRGVKVEVTTIRKTGSATGVSLSRGRLAIARMEIQDPYQELNWSSSTSWEFSTGVPQASYRGDSLLEQIGFVFKTSTPIGRDSRWEVPFWAILMFVLLFPAHALRRFKLARQPGLCRKCGYDLRASPERCPECGHEAKSPA
jgi:hypothetical protein